MYRSKVASALTITLAIVMLLIAGCSSTPPAPTPTPTPVPTPKPAALAISTTSLGNGSVGVAYSQRLQATGGSGSYTWSLSGGSLPSGLIVSAGAVSGTPTASGPFSFTVQVSDSAGATATANLSINIQRVAPIISTSTLPDGKVGAAYSQNLAATDGVPPYTWAIADGSMPAGLSVSGSAISGTPTAAGKSTFAIQVTDSAGSTARANLSINVISVPVITSSTLATGEIAIAYSQPLVVSGGTAPYTWSITSGSLPAGLALSAGVISGTPTASGAFSFTAQVVDSAAIAATASVSLNIAAAPAITTTVLAAGKVGVAYSQTLAASGGISPYTWSVSAGSLPGGLSLSSGVISGMPTTIGTFSFTMKVTDSVGASATANLSIGITTAPVITTSTLPAGEVSIAYSQTLAVSGGVAPYTWSITTGALPAGLSLAASTGVISGMPTASGSFTFTIQVADSQAATATANLSITVAAVPIITTAALPDGKVSIAYSQTLAVSGGTSPYTWSVSSGSLPAGLTLSVAGVISGMPTAPAGTATFAVKVTDAMGVAITANLQIVVAP